MKPLKLCLTAGAIGLGLWTPRLGAENASPEPEPLLVPRATSQIVIDGIIEEDAWDDALILPLEYETKPGENIPPPVKTDVFFTYDESRLYIAFRCQDPEGLPAESRHQSLGGRRRAHLARRGR